MNQGVRQGCSLSPLLFALYLKEMGETLHQSKLGTSIGKDIHQDREGITISAMFFCRWLGTHCRLKIKTRKTFTNIKQLM